MCAVEFAEFRIGQKYSVALHVIGTENIYRVYYLSMAAFVLSLTFVLTFEFYYFLKKHILIY